MSNSIMTNNITKFNGAQEQEGIIPKETVRNRCQSLFAYFEYFNNEQHNECKWRQS
jgi:hypothetical protein